MADRFEYRNHSPFFGPGRAYADRAAWETGLNALGAEGWELVGPVDLYELAEDGSVREAPYTHLLLKRRVE